MNRECFGCGHDNPPDHTFCSQCGSALSLRDFLAASTAKAVSESLRDRDVLETESAIRVFERAWGWAKIVGAIAVALLTIVGLGVFWKVSDWWKAVDAAKTAVTSSAETAKRDIGDKSNLAAYDIHESSTKAINASTQAAMKAERASLEAQRTSQKTEHELLSEAATVSRDTAATRAKLTEVDKLRPQFEAMQSQLSKATDQLSEQQKVLASNENLAKQIFSSHVSYVFPLQSFNQPNEIVVPPPGGQGTTIVYMLLPSSPIPGTVELQYFIFTQPPYSYQIIHNLLIFFWGDAADNLKQHPITVSYFPDKSDKESIRSIALRDGRVFADDQPMPKFNSADPDFKGNKWIPVVPPK